MLCGLSEIALVVSKSARETVQLVLHIVIFRLYICERTVDHTASRPPNCDVSILISIAANSTIRIKNWRVFKIFLVERPVLVDQVTREVTLLAQCSLVDGYEMAVPGGRAPR